MVVSPNPKLISLQHKSDKVKIEILRFHGFKTLDELSRKFFKKGYAYITSTTLIKGELYIFPHRLYDDIKFKNKAYDYVQTVFEDLILPGIIRMYYSHQYNKLQNYV